MTAHELLTTLRDQGVDVLADGTELVLRGEVGKLPGGIIDEARRHKPELLRLLSPRIGHGDLVVPFAADPSAQWWRGGRSVKDTLAHMDAPEDVKRRYRYTH